MPDTNKNVNTPCQGGCGKMRSVLLSDSPVDWLCNECRTNEEAFADAQADSDNFTEFITCEHVQTGV